MTRQERDYSGRSLFEKLGVLAGHHVAVVGRHDEDFVSALNERLAKSASQALRTRYDVIFLRIDTQADVSKIARIRAYLKPNGALWVFHPKGRGAAPTDAEVRTAGTTAGLVDNKISAYTETHTATRFVIPLALR